MIINFKNERNKLQNNNSFEIIILLDVGINEYYIYLMIIYSLNICNIGIE